MPQRESSPGRHRAPNTAPRNNNRRLLTRLTVAGVLLATVLGTVATDPAALAAIGYWLGYPLAVAAAATYGARTITRLLAGILPAALITALAGRGPNAANTITQATPAAITTAVNR